VNLGWCDVCLRVEKAQRSREFYADLGFWRVEGDDEEGWAVVTNGSLRLGLFEPAFMRTPFSLNFRGGDVAAIACDLTAKGHTFVSGPKFSSSGASAEMRDPDGHTIFFDCAKGEVKPETPM
jgi:catechol 2,3-dioxygenase-like lactoylglutathione lyase family enzyme